MKKLIKHLNTLKPSEQEALCLKCGTTVGYIRKAASIKQKLGESLCINFEKETKGAIKCEDIRTDVDWQFLRGTNKTKLA